MSAHVDIDGDCPLAVVPCQYSDIGCKHKVRMVTIVTSYLITIFLEVRYYTGHFTMCDGNFSILSRRSSSP